MKNKGIIFLIIILILLVAVAGILLAMKIIDGKVDGATMSNGIISLGTEQGKEKEEVKTVNIYNGVDRPIAVMIDNHKGAWPQARTK